MESKPVPIQWWLKKRPNESESSGRANKRLAVACVNIADEKDEGVRKIYKFRVLLPNGTSLGLKIRHPDGDEMAIEDFVKNVREEYFRAMKQTESHNKKRQISWKSKELYFADAFDRKITKRVDFRKFSPNKYHILRLHDGSGEVDTYENMWDLTPHTDLLLELPEEYTFETALADLIDNSLQAVWSNGVNKRKLISVEIVKDKISIFDTGPGMDGSDENSIVKWGKMGASLHRSSRGQAIGGKPPYLTPFFGMFGYGGPIASMHLGRHVMVSSKTKESKKVYTLHLEREALLNSSGSEHRWRTDGGIRLPIEDEIQKSPHGTFTKVEIFEPKMKSLDILQLQCKLKDVYFPYIQCDEVSNTGKTIRPIEFQVNGNDLAEIKGGEVAITNLNSCNGPDFVLHLHFHLNQDLVATSSPGAGARASGEANARLKCVYFPVVEGKERIEIILDKLEAEEYGVTEKFESFSRVSIRRLGRLLPDARWLGLPFMEPRQRVGERAKVLKRCCLRVKCFIETDAGFNPTPSKTDLAHRHPYTTALRNFGNKPKEKEKEVNIEIYRDGKLLTLLQLERQYQEWIYQMHGLYDEETVCGEDEPVLIVSPSNKKSLGISLDVVRVHKVIRRKGTSWKFGQKIKVLKGACTGCHKNNVYATVEYILLEGFQGDSGVGEARLICRPLGVPDDNGCILVEGNGNPRIDIRGSMCLPISVIDSGKCLAIESSEWNNQLEKHRQKIPSTIDILTAKHCQQLEVEGALPVDATVCAGHVPPKEIVAVVRPASFNSASASKILYQKYIVKDSLEMAIEVKFRSEDKNLQTIDHIYSGCVKPSSLKGIHGFYIFALGRKIPRIFQKAGVYIFSFSLRGSKTCEKRVQVKVKALSEVGSWGLLSKEQSEKHSVRVGSYFPPLSIACYDMYKNRIPFPSIPKVMAKIGSDCDVLGRVLRFKVDLSSTKLTLKIKDTLIESNELDKIRPSYGTTLLISPQDESFSVAIPCEVSPGSLQRVEVQEPNLEKQLLPRQIIKELVLEMFDAYGNHVRGGVEVKLNVNGLRFQDQMEDQMGYVCKVDQYGCVDLSGQLRVTGGYGKNVSLSVLSSQKVVFKREYQTEIRKLRVACKVPESCAARSKLENVVFEVVDSKGDLDVTIHDEQKYGVPQTLTIKSDSLDTDDSVQYSFQHGRCVVRAIALPDIEGIFSFVAAHSRYPELNIRLQVRVEKAQKADHAGVKTPYSDGNVLRLQDPCVLKTLKLEHGDVHHQFSDGNILFQDPSTSEQVGNLAGSKINKQQEFEKDIFSMGPSIEQHEKTLEKLNDQKTAIEQVMSKLQGSMETDLFHNSGYSLEKEMMDQIVSNGNSAAAVICRLFREFHQEQQNPLTQHVVGVVALLGIVQTNEHSRILSEYLGEDQMLAVVCMNYAAADALERYEQNGNVDRAHALHAAATGLGKSISGRYLVICVEDIRPYTGDVRSDHQRKLALPDPTLSNGGTPTGYLGYAVNMIDLDVQHLCTRTTSGHSLRETLFYYLFGELQVYETRDDLKKAKAYIKHGAVSLDGEIFRGNGVISLGYREPPHIQFPVYSQGSQMRFSSQTMEILEQIEEKKSELKETQCKIEKMTKTHKKRMKKFKKRKERHTDYSPDVISSKDSLAKLTS